MKIIRTDTTTNTRKVISFSDACNRLIGFNNHNKSMRIFLNCRLLENKAFTDRKYKYERKLG